MIELVKICTITMWLTAGSIYAQDNALIILFKGDANSFIHPVVFADDTLSKPFCDTNMRVFGSVSVPRKLVSFYYCSEYELNYILNKFSKKLENEKEVEGRCTTGKFHFIYHENGLKKEEIILERDKALNVINEVLNELEYSETGFNTWNTALSQLMLQFQEEPYIKVQDSAPKPR